MQHPWQHRRQMRIDPLIDRALDIPSGDNLDTLVAAAERRPTKLAERIRRRAAYRARRAPDQTDALLHSRQRLLQKLYAAEAPGYLTAWSDAAVFPGRKDSGIGGLLCNPDGETLVEFSIRHQGCDVLAAEIDAAVYAMELAVACGMQRLRLHTDCTALVDLWCRKRDDARLRPLLRTHRSVRLKLRGVPRLHNQRADWLARRAVG